VSKTADEHPSPAADRTGEPIDLRLDERAYAEQLARAHAALAEAQDRSYWLDRWGVDLNSLMRRPGARRARAALRMVREVKRGSVTVKRYAQRRLDTLRTSAAEDEMAAAAPIHATADQPRQADRSGAADRQPPTRPDSTRA
jgi:hypothetical protein